MAAKLEAIVAECDRLLNIQGFTDYCPNGLQVEGKHEVQRVVAGVTASQRFIEQAIEAGADAILVHHGFFWRGEAPAIVGIKRKRIAALLAHDVSLLAYHLPLDAHAQLGNNVQLARRLGIQVDGCVQQGDAKGLLWHGHLDQAVSAGDFSSLIETRLQRVPLHLASTRNQPIRTLAWCSGGAQGYIEGAADLGVDAYLSGEASEQTFHLARERDIHYFGAGHHATERYGVQALAEHLGRQFDLQWQFIDIDNPV